METREFYSAREVAGKLGISVDTVWRWVKIGALKATKLSGRKMLIPQSELVRISEGLWEEPEKDDDSFTERTENICRIPADGVDAVVKEWMVSLLGLSGNALVLYAFIATATGSGKGVIAKMNELTSGVNISPETFKKIIQRFEREGLMKVSPVTGHILDRLYEPVAVMRKEAIAYRESL